MSMERLTNKYETWHFFLHILSKTLRIKSTFSICWATFFFVAFDLFSDYTKETKSIWGILMLSVSRIAWRTGPFRLCNTNKYRRGVDSQPWMAAQCGPARTCSQVYRKEQIFPKSNAAAAAAEVQAAILSTSHFWETSWRKKGWRERQIYNKKKKMSDPATICKSFLDSER